MIVLFTDFGLQGPYTGQMPAGNPKALVYLLAAYAQWFPIGTVFLCAVDPGVGGTRPPIVVEADGHRAEGSHATARCGLVEIAGNQGRADRELGLTIGMPIEIVA